MRFEAFSRKPALQRADCLVIGVFDKGELGKIGAEVDLATKRAVQALLQRGDFSGNAGETLLLPDVRGIACKRLLLVGLGPRAQFQRRAWRRGLHSAITALGRTRIGSAAIALETPESVSDYYLGRGVAEQTGLAQYRINDQKSNRRPRPPALERILVGPVADNMVNVTNKGLAAGAALAQSAVVLRNLGNLPPNICTPRYLAARAQEMQRQYRGRLRVKALDEPAMRRLKMGCLLAVSKGSEEPARLITMEYRGGGRSQAPVVLVGKGITFDTGGISLKDPGAMDEMKFDMCGAATVIAALDYAARMRLPLNVVGIVAAAENMPDGHATRPADIVTSAAGLTVEILNTDAEGRLVLCDALHYARRYKPAVVVDFATLTGACVIALGSHHSGLMANDDALATELLNAGLRADDRAWRLPLLEEYTEQLRSNFADLANIGGREAGTITAGAFLAKFTEGLHWAHMDIAGTAYAGGAAKGATGRPLSLVADFLCKRAKAIPPGASPHE